jgi:hypothetical protein
MLNPHEHIVPLLLKLKEHFRPPPSTSNITKVPQLDKGLGKIQIVWWCIGFQSSMIGELKHIRISSFEHLIHASLPLEYNQVL